jgi:predicted  nucleic acid-binding Zn-ribbon protein
MSAPKVTPAWADATAPHACRHCGHVCKASVWRFQRCPRCGSHGQSAATVASTWQASSSRPAPRPTRPLPPEALTPPEAIPMTDGERALLARARELARRMKGAD